MKKRINFMITAFRDGFQSVFGARVFTKDFLPAVEAASEAGIKHFEAGGGARFQSLYFYCNEDAFTMMDQFRETAGPDADLQTLARGINVVGLDSQPRDIIKLHSKLFAKHGITTIRNFDALNDVNNLIYSGQCIVDAGLRHEICITMMELPPGVTGAHDPDFYTGVLRKILDAGVPFDSLCFKDASGTSAPAKVFDTIKQARKLLGDDKNIVFHTHETAGTSVISYKSALKAGADQIDLSLRPVSGGTGQPDIITMWHALRGSEFDLGIDINKVIEAEEVFKECMADYFIPPEATTIEPLIPFAPMPGGALTANTQMMRDNGLLHKYSEVAAAMGEAVTRGGFGTSVTPVSQFYFQQAFNNVMLGSWKKIAEGYGKMLLGYFGKTPVEPDSELIELAQDQLGLEPTKRSPIDINDEDPKKGAAAAEEMLKQANLPITEENIFIAATCKEKGILFLQGKAKANVRKIEKEEKTAPETAEGYTVTVNGKSYGVKIEGGKAVVNGKTYDIAVKSGLDEAAGTAAEKSVGGTTEIHDMEAPIPGLVLRIEVAEGDEVEEGETVMVLESMKQETPVTATVDGIISKIPVSQGDQVTAGQLLVAIEKA
ncbi:MAG: biotin/lipoyl-containing protein [Spirochaetia bacterium]